MIMNRARLLGLVASFVLLNDAIANSNLEPSKRVLLEDNYYTIMSRLDELTNKVQTLEAQTAVHTHPPTAFEAYLSSSISGGQKQVIVFDQVKTNIGNAYNNHHGNFIAPVNGTYMFTIYACSGGDHAIVLDLMKNSDSIGRVLSGDQSYTECTSRVFVTYLVAGDDIYVHEGTYGSLLASYPQYGEPGFTGVLIQAH